MSESKGDDKIRSPIKEYFKKRIVNRFDGAIVGGGSPQGLSHVTGDGSG